MPTATASDTLRTGTPVVARTALKGVPEGTAGKVIHVQGLTWTRYWVLFDNGRRVGTIDRSKLATPEEWGHAATGSSAPTGVVVAAGAEAADAGSAAAAESVGGVPAYLLERSKKARERWAAKAAG
jgi:hypothetical protein